MAYNHCTWKYTEVMDKILGGRPATNPQLMADTLDSSADTEGIIDDDQEMNKFGRETMKMH